jgi:predicted Rdx family selenoprotein
MNRLNPNYFHVFRFWTFSLSRQERPVASPCPSVLIYRRGSHWKDFREICYWRLYENMSRQCRFGYILTKNIGLFTRWPKRVSYFGQRLVETNNAAIELLCFHSNTFSMYYIVYSDFCVWTIQRQRIVAFPWQRCLRERALVLRYTYIVCLAKILFDSF